MRWHFLAAASLTLALAFPAAAQTPSADPPKRTVADMIRSMLAPKEPEQQAAKEAPAPRRAAAPRKTAAKTRLPPAAKTRPPPVRPVEVRLPEPLDPVARRVASGFLAVASPGLDWDTVMRDDPAEGESASAALGFAE